MAKLNAGFYMLLGLLVFIAAVGGWIYYVCKQEHKRREWAVNGNSKNKEKKNRGGTRSPEYRELVSIKLS